MRKYINLSDRDAVKLQTSYTHARESGASIDEAQRRGWATLGHHGDLPLFDFVDIDSDRSSTSIVKSEELQLEELRTQRATQWSRALVLIAFFTSCALCNIY